MGSRCAVSGVRSTETIATTAQQKRTSAVANVTKATSCPGDGSALVTADTGPNSWLINPRNAGMSPPLPMPVSFTILGSPSTLAPCAQTLGEFQTYTTPLLPRCNERACDLAACAAARTTCWSLELLQRRRCRRAAQLPPDVAARQQRRRQEAEDPSSPIPQRWAPTTPGTRLSAPGTCAQASLSAQGARG